MNKFIMLPVAALMVTLMTSCKKESQPAEENDNELITTVQLDFSNRATSETSTFIWEDADGPGGELPYIDTIMLAANSTYDVKVSFWNKSVTPAEDITNEVKAESENHRVYYEPSASSGITVGELDNDTGGIPLGVSSRWSTTGSGTGTILIVLRHYANGGKAADDPVNSSKSATDAGAIFDVKVVN
jgi:hypothetical protein